MNFRRAFLAALALIACIALPFSARADDDIQEHRSCVRCGMDRKAYGYSRMLITYQDGGKTGICSLHCAVSELASHPERVVAGMLVADRDSQQMIDPEKAFWVMGGKKRGVMTRQPKWAFGTEAAARAFIASNGGVMASWAETVAAARSETAHAPRSRK